AAARWPSFAREIGGDSSNEMLGYRALGTIVTATSEAARLHLIELAVRAALIGQRAALLDASDIRSLEPGLTASVQAGLHFPEDALVEPPLVVAALRAALVKAGCEILSAHVASLEPTSSGVSVVTNVGRIMDADAVVVATGWSAAPALAPELSGLFPVKGQILTVSGVDRAPRHMLRGEGVYLAPRSDGRIDIGATSEPGLDDLNVRPEAIIALRQKADALFPALLRAPTIASRAGVRPGSPDHGPLLGRSSLGDAVYLAAGAYRNGVLLAPLIADILADAVLGTEGESRSSHWLQRFSARRFSS
ncbi:MAG: FAD-dependent oxidoreductase, partial [Caulobacterales bacterium]